MTNTVLEDSLRKVAILVASLDEAWSERILGSLSAQDVKLVRQHLERFTEIDPDEQETVVAEFRRSLSQTKDSASDGVEIEASLLERIDHQDYSLEVPRGTANFESISTADAESLTEILSGESLQTIAVVLSRLETDRAAEVLSKFPMGQQTEILNRLEQLGDTDEHAVAVIDAQINHWIATQRQRRDRMAAGRQMVERLMSRTLRNSGDIIVSAKLPQTAHPIANDSQTLPGTRPRTTPPPVRYERVQAPSVSQEVATTNSFAHLTASECVSQLEQLPDELLFAAFSRLESLAVSLALVGASEKLMKRVMRRLSRREAKELRRQLRNIGPTRLSDILAAQQEVLYTATQLN